MAGQGLQLIPFRIPEKWDAAWYGRHLKEVLALADTRNAIEGSGIVITGQPGEAATISTSEDLQNLLLQSFVVASPSGFLNFERVLAGETGVIDIDDGGANSTITVSIEDHGINLGKLVELSGAGILGNPVDAVGEIQNINPEQALAVLHFDGTGIVFDLVDHTYVSDFDEAARDAVGLILVYSSSINFTYDDALETITANVIESWSPTWTANHRWTDNDEIQLGTGGDLRLYHDGTNSYVRNDTGALNLAIGVNTHLQLQSLAANFGYNTAAGFSLSVNSAAGNQRNINLQSAGVNRWIVRVDSVAESGGNAGSDFSFRARADDGSDLGAVFAGTRSTGAVQLGYGSSSHVRLPFDNQELRIGAAATGDLRLYHDGTNSLIRNDTGVLQFSMAGTVRVSMTQDGRLFGGALHNNAGAVTGATNQYIASGTYTPTLTAVTNVAASTARLCSWMRVGNVVTVSGQCDVDPTIAGDTELGISLPIASALSTAFQLGGSGNFVVADANGPAIDADATNDRARARWVAVDVTNHTMTFTFTYEVL